VITYGGRPLEAAIRRGHGSFSPPQTLGSGVYASAATMNARGDAAVVWANSSRNLLGAYAPAGSGFGAGQLLGAIPFGVGGQLITPPLSPDVAIDGSGRATAVWEQGDGETVRLQSRDIGAAGPGPLTTAETVSAFDQVAPPSACTPSGGRVLLRGSRAVVVRTPGGTFGCLLARGELVPLNRTYPYPRGDASPTQPYQPPAMTLAGPFLASVVEIGNHDASTSTLMTLTDLRDEVSGIGRAANATPPARGQVGERAVVPALKLKPNGAMAWIACAVDFRRPPNVRRTCRRPGGLTKQLWAWNLADGKPRLVAHGKRIDPRTLKLNGSRLTWKAGKRHRAATLQ